MKPWLNEFSDLIKRQLEVIYEETGERIGTITIAWDNEYDQPGHSGCGDLSKKGEKA